MNSKLLTLTSRQERLLEQAVSMGALKRPATSDERRHSMPEHLAAKRKCLGAEQLYLNDCAALQKKGLCMKSGKLTRLGKIISAGLWYGSETLNEKG